LAKNIGEMILYAGLAVASAGSAMFIGDFIGTSLQGLVSIAHLAVAVGAVMLLFHKARD